MPQRDLLASNWYADHYYDIMRTVLSENVVSTTSAEAVFHFEPLVPMKNLSSDNEKTEAAKDVTEIEAYHAESLTAALKEGWTTYMSKLPVISLSDALRRDVEERWLAKNYYSTMAKVLRESTDKYQQYTFAPAIALTEIKDSKKQGA